MIDILIAGLILLIVLALGLSKRSQKQTLSDYTLAEKGYPSWIIFATLSASFIGGGFSMGVSEKTALLGIGYIIIMWGFSLKEILVAKFIAPHMSQFPTALTIGDIMESKLGKIGKLTAGFLSILVCGGVIGAQIVAIGHIFHHFLGVSLVAGIITGSSIVILYSTIGGIRSIIITDIFQFCILSIGIPLLAILTAFTIFFDPNLNLAQLDSTLLSIPSKELHLTQIASLFLVFLVGETLVPPYVQRLLIGKSTEETTKGTLQSGLFSIIFFAIAGILGLQALILNPSASSVESIPYLINTILPIGLRGIVIAGLISAVMSTADSFLHAAAVAFTHDVITPLSTENNEKREYILSQIGTLIIGIIAITLALKFQSIIDLCLKAWTLWSPIMIVPLVAIIRSIPYTKKDFYWGTAAALIAIFITPDNSVDPLVTGVLANCMITTIRVKFLN